MALRNPNLQKVGSAHTVAGAETSGHTQMQLVQPATPDSQVGVVVIGQLNPDMEDRARKLLDGVEK